MRIRIYEQLKLKFENPIWARDTRLALIDTVLETHTYLFDIVAPDIMAGMKNSIFGRADSPSVEQITRAAIYKEIKGLTYRELEYAQVDSRICEHFLRINPLRPYTFQMYQEYISRISSESLSKLLVAINKIAIENEVDDLEAARLDSTVVETDIHYPTNNSLVWDCIKEIHGLLKKLKKEISAFEYENYRIEGKKTYFKINVSKAGDERVDLFKRQLQLFTKCIDQVSTVISEKPELVENERVTQIYGALESLLPILNIVYDMTHKKEILGIDVPNDEKIFSIYELHTDIIVKGQRECKFGHNIDISTGRSNLIFTCDIQGERVSDKTRLIPTIDTLKADYDKTPNSVVTDGGYASKANKEQAVKKGIKNVVFNKITKSMKNAAESPEIEEELKRWRSGIEANISNLKRGFNLRRCMWKGWEHFKQKVYWSIIAYNIRVITGHMLKVA